MPFSFPTPIFRFFDEKKYAEKMLNTGEIFFNVISAFNNLQESKFKDEGELFHEFRPIDKPIPKNEEFDKLFKNGSMSIKSRRIPDAWALCATTSLVSTAKKNHCIIIRDIENLLDQLAAAIKKKFDEDLYILFGPVSYFAPKSNPFSSFQPPPYLTKREQFKSDLEFRIVILPSQSMYKNGDTLKPLILKIDKPSEVFKNFNDYFLGNFI